MISVTKNGKKNHDETLVEKGRVLKKPTRKGKIQKEVVIDEARSFIVEEGELLMRVPSMIHQLIYLLERPDKSVGLDLLQSYYPKMKYEDPMRACLLVGSLSRNSIGHIDSYDYIIENIEEIVRDDYRSRIIRIARRNADFDGVLITKNITATTPSILAKKLIEKIPPIEIEDFEGYEFHGDCNIREREFLQLKEFYDEDPDFKIGAHQLEVLEKNKDKEKKPVILWQSGRIDSKIKEIFDEYVNNGWLRTLQEYYDETWYPYEKAFKERFPEEYERIHDDIKKELRIFQKKFRINYLKEPDY